MLLAHVTLAPLNHPIVECSHQYSVISIQLSVIPTDTFVFVEVPFLLYLIEVNRTLFFL